MPKNGHRRPPRPRLRVEAAGASADETAAITAALERFLSETSPSPEAQEPSRWLQAALREGVEARRGF